MKTKEVMRGFGVEVISASSSAGASDLLSGEHSSAEEEVMMDSPSVMKEEDQVSSSSPMVLTPVVSSDDSEEEDASSADDDSDWEDIDEDDLEDDDGVCIMFQDDCDVVVSSTNPRCSLNKSYGPSSSSGPCPKINVPTIKINGFIKINSHGSHQISHCWLTKMTQQCQKRLKACPLRKKVRFNDKELVQVIEFEDDEESKQMRKLYWERFAIDRCRFKERIHRTEEAIGHIFDKAHRDKVYENYENRMEFQDQNENLPVQNLEAIINNNRDFKGFLPSKYCRPFPCCVRSTVQATSSQL